MFKRKNELVIKTNEIPVDILKQNLLLFPYNMPKYFKDKHLLIVFLLILALINTIFISLHSSSEIIVGQISDSAKIADEGFQ